MKIDIDLTKEQCMDILHVNDYVREEATLYYALDASPYDKDRLDYISDLRAIQANIAYKKGHRPEFLDSEYPMLEDAEEYMFDGVVNKLVNSMLVNSILGNFTRT